MTERNVLSLFTGAGGLDLGFETAGFAIRLCVEVDEDARKTLKLNRPSWMLAEPADIHVVDPSSLLRQAGLRKGTLTLLAGGPPCQPFSKSGYWSNGDSRRLRDPRSNTLHAFLQVVEATLPHVLLLENVEGLGFDGKDEGLQLIKDQIKVVNRRRRTRYKPQVIYINAADYGVPQIRKRVFIVASVDGRTLEMPDPTHGERHGCEPYRSSWDAIADLDTVVWPQELKPSGKWSALLPSIPEGQNYLWHTPRNEAIGGTPLFGWRARYWSFLLKLAKNKPSWTIQAEPGPATGPFHWKSRLLSIKELCRLQTFPNDYMIEGSIRSARRQVGNAVPSAIGELLGLEIRRQLLGEKVRRRLRLIPTRRDDCPSPESVTRVSLKYLPLRSSHKDHLGPGLGPGARRAIQSQVSIER